MSRPTIPRTTASPRGIDLDKGQTSYFGMRFADLVALAENLARDPSGVAVPGSTAHLASGVVAIPGKDRGLARTLVEIPALFAHILGEHQSYYAAEAFLGTATSPDSLIRHARKLAYVPDQGVAATGLAVFDVKESLSGTIPESFALQSEPKGDIKSQTYETLAAAEVAAEWNAIAPREARLATRILFSSDLADLPLLGPSGLDIGDIVLLQGQGKSAVCEVMSESDLVLRLRRLSKGLESTGTWPPFDASDPYVLLAAPQTEARIFGHAANPLTFPPAELASSTLYVQPSAVGVIAHGYRIEGLSSGTYDPGATLILAETIDSLEPGAPLALLQANAARPIRLNRAREAMVSFLRGERIAIPQPDTPPANFPTNQLAEQSISARVSLLDLWTIANTAISWSGFPLDGVIYGNWTRTIAIAPDEPNPAPLTSTVEVAADLSQMRPGRSVVVQRRSDGYATPATITRLEPTVMAWSVSLSFDAGEVASSFTMGDVHLRANTAPVSHGETVTEILGASDGVTPHQSFELKKAGVTRIASVAGSTIELAVRVDGVLWDQVDDFHAAAPEARVYRADAGEDGKTWVSFGGEGRGAVPPSGSRNVTAHYRVGLGTLGDTETGRLTRIKKASPLVNAVTNLLPLAGGTDPAGAEDIRSQATKPILTFDRAVSLRDHADLALLFPGVARASARWLDRGAVELIAADAKGDPPADPASLRAFMETRRDNEVPLELLEPQAVDIALSLRVERDAAWLADAVRRDVAETLLGAEETDPGLFTFAGRDFSAPQSLSGVYARVLAREGVTGVVATQFAIQGQTGVADILHATDRQWLRLQPSALTIDITDPGALIPEFEGGAL